MAPRDKKAPGAADKNRRQRETGILDPTPIVKASSGIQNKRPVTRSAESQPVPSYTTQPARTKHKRSQATEAEADEPKDAPSAKQHRKDIPCDRKSSTQPLQKQISGEAEAEGEVDESEGVYLSEKRQESTPLSEQDLEALYKEVMDAAANRSRPLKRTLASEEITYRSKSSSSTQFFYRTYHLRDVGIQVYTEPPDYIEAAVNSIANTEVSKQRRAEVSGIARKLHDDWVILIQSGCGEDCGLHPLYGALRTLSPKSLISIDKAAWREELKPVKPCDDFSFLNGVSEHAEEVEVDSDTDRAQKRQKRSTTSPGNDSQDFILTNTPVALGPMREEDRYPIKTPIPDLSIGLHLDALTTALSQSLNFSKVKTTRLIDWLQTEMIQHKPDTPFEPALLFRPAERAFNLAFPFAVVEGKAYSTGKQIFEAENQAAVAGACGLKIQLGLDRLVNKGSGVESTQPPLFFSITTQGPIHELWYHWTVEEDGIRTFESNLLDSWNAMLVERGGDFVIRLNNVLTWGAGPFARSVVERLEVAALTTLAG
ncbi:hypothetical protein A1O3_06050 [Capronia epimyces CBS 606.96]|uniref:Uncharacterized protein n=1 Tax=Capronia epimyces CBS 606.96 TaxID=1182542 RepID=W9XNV9_9EURO|nr:uncharacterized protein A1O3_06050 [Capronia epimyces CBS 606.96]EXJ82237.1 hypothetical protein A1O3_06050 [Capronia epimyces CBS 606.96]